MDQVTKSIHPKIAQWILKGKMEMPVGIESELLSRRTSLNLRRTLDFSNSEAFCGRFFIEVTVSVRFLKKYSRFSSWVL